MVYYRDKQFDSVLLETEQQHLLETLVEASRRVPRDHRQKFIVANAADSHLSFLLHDGLLASFEGAYEGDLEALANEGMLSRMPAGDGTPMYDVTPRGFKYYEHLQLAKGTPVFRTESAIRHLIEKDAFQSKQPAAFNKWTEAEKLLWSADSDSALTTIGHLCREALQEFVDGLGKRLSAEMPGDKAKTVARFRAICRRAQLTSPSAVQYVDALLVLVGTLSDLIQKQEHGGLREGEPLRWEDGRRLVFLTLVSLVEIDRLLDHA